jgi:hypothetical protein
LGVIDLAIGSVVNSGEAELVADGKDVELVTDGEEFLVEFF